MGQGSRDRHELHETTSSRVGFGARRLLASIGLTAVVVLIAAN